MLRGINQLQLFYDSTDRPAFIERMTRYKKECGFLLLAYSLMGNHVHLLMQEQQAELAEIVRRLTTSYTHWYNTRYERSGYLFQGRYKSETVENESYLLEAVRYIHNNPVKIHEPVNSWTSYDDYVKRPTLVETDMVLGLFADAPTKARSSFEEFICERQDEERQSAVLGNNTPRRPKDAEAIELIKHIGNVTHCAELAEKDREQRNRTLVLLKREGLSIRQLSRLTGINRGVVLKAGK
jgi:REP element-mobilizing transposase RayT